MKSAYELAMEQKAQIAEIDSKFKARLAERELFLKDQISKAAGAGNAEEAESLQKQLAGEIRRLQEEAEVAKEKLRTSFSR